MRTLKSFFLNKTFLLVFIIIGALIGCDDQGCGNSCSGGLFCPTSREECECVARIRGCSFSFNEERGRCSISNCSECALLVGRCREARISQDNNADAEILSIFSFDNSCDVFTNTDTENECEDLAIDRECQDMDVVASAEENYVNECWLYECQQCSL